MHNGWTTLVKCDLAPQSWGQIDAMGHQKFHVLVENTHPLFQFADNGWKLNHLATSMYLSWEKTYISNNNFKQGRLRSKNTMSEEGSIDNISGQSKDSEKKCKPDDWDLEGKDDSKCSKDGMSTPLPALASSELPELCQHATLPAQSPLPWEPSHSSPSPTSIFHPSPCLQFKSLTHCKDPN
ncbi:hypothetical protein BS17DRAFT_769759 [Gyrodon lividus]|nr:hypothetical protein BS17DRAFT_769759 [Gyrodon lividus]